jgi:TolB-like protein
VTARRRSRIMRRVVYVVEYQMRKSGMRIMAAAVVVRPKEGMHRSEDITNYS